MKKILSGILLLFFSFTLISCASANKDLEFSNTKWGMSVDEFLDAKKMAKNDFSSYDEFENYVSIIEDSSEEFGQKPESVNYLFDKLSDTGDFVLTQITIMYSDDADMDTVQKEIEKKYGKPADEITTFSMSATSDDAVQSAVTKTNDTHVVFKGKNLGGLIDSKNEDSFKAVFKDYFNMFTDEQWQEYKESAPASYITINKSDSFHVVTFVGMNTAIYNHLKK